MGEGERATVIRVLEEAGARHLARVEPKRHGVFLMYVGCARRFPAPDSETFWRGIQSILDHFFEPPQRAEICTQLLEGGTLGGCQASPSFVANALAERRLQVMLEETPLTWSMVAR